MSDLTEIRRFGVHKNAFGALRLLFASLVILSHTPEITDGNRDREVLTRAFGTISFGDLAVTAFFIISGYLITDSFVKSPSVGRYLINRIARIYPAFLVSTLVCLLVVSPIGGAHVSFSMRDFSTAAVRAFLLVQPNPANNQAVFIGSHYPILNGSAWTIAYEFLCYLLVIALGYAGLLKRPLAVAAIAAALFLAYAIISGDVFGHGDAVLHGHPFLRRDTERSCRLFGAFLVGALYFLYRDKVRFTRGLALAAVPLLILCLYSNAFADVGMAAFGGYLILFVAKRGGDTILVKINNPTDISYGVYLYGWPVEKVLAWYLPNLGLAALGVSTLAIALLLGWLSWHLVEGPVMRAVRRPRPLASL